jgi:hypothetical protein
LVLPNEESATTGISSIDSGWASKRLVGWSKLHISDNQFGRQELRREFDVHINHVHVREDDNQSCFPDCGGVYERLGLEKLRTHKASLIEHKTNSPHISYRTS